MRTKALLLGAAALAAGLITSQAQVYSANIVGYVNLSLTNGVLSAAAAQLDADGTGTNNTILSELGTNLPSGQTVYVFNGSGYDILTFAPLTKGGTPVWQSGGVADPTYPLNPGKGFFILPNTTTNITVVGTVLQGVTNSYTATAGVINLVSDQLPIGGGVTTTLGYPASNGDTLYLFNGSGYNIYSYAPLTKGGTPVWQSGGVASEPQVNVGQSFFLIPKVTTTWTNGYIQ